MPRRASVPEGKAVFFRGPEPAEEEETAEAPVAAAAPSAGKPVARGSTRQSAIFLEEQHLDWLEDRCREARRNGGRAVRKAAVIRALLDVAMQSPIDLTTLRGEGDLVERIRRGLRG